MLTDLIKTNTCCLKQPFLFTEEVESHHFPYIANHPGGSPIWVTPVWWLTRPNQPKMNWHKFSVIKVRQTENQMFILQTTLKWRTTLKQGEFSLRTPSISYNKDAVSVWYICTTITRGLKHLQTWIKKIKSNVYPVY